MKPFRLDTSSKSKGREIKISLNKKGFSTAALKNNNITSTSTSTKYCLQQVSDYVRGCTQQLKNVKKKAIYRFHK